MHPTLSSRSITSSILSPASRASKNFLRGNLIMTALSIVLGTQHAFSLSDGVGKLPGAVSSFPLIQLLLTHLANAAMGYNTWNAYGCNITQELVLESAQLMVSLGLQEAGYQYVNIDDCWSEKNRSENGDLVPDATKFSLGLKNLTDTIHDMGFQTGIYGDSGWFTCGGYPGSFENEERDALAFHNWGFDYLKYDNCAIPFDDIIRQGTYQKYSRMADAIANVAANTSSTPMLFSLCEWGWNQVWIWGKQYGQSWRTTGDIQAEWSSVADLINFNSFITMATDFYGHNDMDMLEVGNGNLTYEETKSHFTAWALMKSPLLIGTNLSAISKPNLEILTNKEIIAINQDSEYGIGISPFRWGVNPDWTSDPKNPANYWSGPSQNGTVIMLLNTLDTSADITFNLTESPWINAGRQYHVRDLWTHTDNGTAVRNFTAESVPSHGVVALLLQDAGDEPDGIYPPCAGMALSQCITENGTAVGS